MTHQKIRPHTKNPTANAATTEPIHRSYILCDCVVIPSGHPNPWNVSPTEHPERSVTAPTAEMASPTARAALEPLTTTCSCLLSSTAVARIAQHQRQKASPTVGTLLDHARSARLGGAVSGSDYCREYGRIPGFGNRDAAGSRCAAGVRGRV